MNAPSLEQAELERLVRRAQTGEGAAQQTLIEIYQKRVGGFVYGMTSRPSLVDDLCQAIFVKMVLSLPRLREPARFEPWLFRMARNHCLSHLRRERFYRLFSPLSDSHHEVAAPPAPDREPSAELLLLRAALKELPDKERALLLQVQNRESDYREVAASLNVSVGALKTRVHRARQALKEKMERIKKREEADEKRRITLA